MAVKDDLLYNYFVLCTDLSKKEIEEISSELEQKENYKEMKMRWQRKLFLYTTGQRMLKKPRKIGTKLFRKWCAG